jgi:hypothetical protein
MEIGQGSSHGLKKGFSSQTGVESSPAKPKGHAHSGFWRLKNQEMDADFLRTGDPLNTSREDFWALDSKIVQMEESA